MAWLLVGAFIGIFLYLAYRVLYLHLRGNRTTGVVVAVRRDDSGDAVIFHPTVRFTTDTGLVITAESFFGTSEAGTYFRIGQQVDIQYSAHNPKFFAIAGYDVAALLLFFLVAAMLCGFMYWGYLHN